MTEFFLIFLVFIIVMLVMAVGVIFGRKPISGSCGGLGAVGVERACGCKDVCKNEGEIVQKDNQENSTKPMVYKP